jgi:hypothetical protein
VQWSPRGAETAALVVVGIALALGAVLLDPAGRLLAGCAAALALALAARDLLSRPRLSAGADGVQVRTLSGRRDLAWADVRVQVRVTRRLGMSSRLLELDTARGPDDAGVLVLLGRRDLGTDPDDVARALRELDPRR